MIWTMLLSFPQASSVQYSCLYNNSALVVCQKSTKNVSVFTFSALIRHQRDRFKQKWNAYWDECVCVCVCVCLNHSQSCIKQSLYILHKQFSPRWANTSYLSRGKWFQRWLSAPRPLLCVFLVFTPCLIVVAASDWLRGGRKKRNTLLRVDWAFVI